MRLYITGGTGFVGSNIIKVAVEQYQAQVFTMVHSWRAAGEMPFAYEQIDMLEPDRVFDSVQRFAPDAIIHSAILNDFNVMYANRKLAWESYVGATRTMTEAANRVGAKVILVSSDWVFDGTQSAADEFTPPNPVNFYGVLKTVCEMVVHETAKDGAVARISAVSGRHWLRPDTPRSQDLGLGYFVKAIVENLQRGEPFTVWEADNINMFATPSLASESAEMILRILQLDRQGVFYCCGGESIGRMNLARATAEAFDLDIKLLRPGTPDWGNMAGIPVPYDTSLSAVYTARQLEYDLPNVRQLLMSYRHQVETGLW